VSENANRSSGGSDTNRAGGAVGTKQAVELRPETPIIVGLDGEGKTEEERWKSLRARWEGHPKAQAFIDAHRQPSRVAAPPPGWMVRSIARIGCPEPPTVTRMPPDVRGDIVFVVCNGRQRTMAARLAQTLRRDEGLPPLTIVCNLRRLDEPNAARVFKAVSNTAVEMSPMERVRELKAIVDGGASIEHAGEYFGLESKQSVLNWLALCDAPEAVQHAVDSRAVSMGAAVEIVKSGASLEEQIRRVKEIRGKQAKGQRAKAIAKGKDPGEIPKFKRRNIIASFTTSARAVDSHEARVAIAVARWVAGEPTALNGFPVLKAIAREAEKIESERSADTALTDSERESLAGYILNKCNGSAAKACAEIGIGASTMKVAASGGKIRDFTASRIRAALAKESASAQDGATTQEKQAA
jgi:hypothetical protein